MSDEVCPFRVDALTLVTPEPLPERVPEIVPAESAPEMVALPAEIFPVTVALPADKLLIIEALSPEIELNALMLPLEFMLPLTSSEYAGVVVKTENRCNVVARDRAPVTLLVINTRPAFDAREQSIDSGTIETNCVGDGVQRARPDLPGHAVTSDPDRVRAAGRRIQFAGSAPRHSAGPGAEGSSPGAAAAQTGTSVGSGGTYNGVILWPEIREQTTLIAPVPALARGRLAASRRPMVVPFYGAYWIFKPPDRRPPSARGSRRTAGIAAQSPPSSSRPPRSPPRTT